MHRSPGRQDQSVYSVSLDQLHIPYPMYRVEDHDPVLVRERRVLVRPEEDERNAFYRAVYLPCGFDRPPVLGDIFVAENVDLHAAPV